LNCIYLHSDKITFKYPSAQAFRMTSMKTEEPSVQTRLPYLRSAGAFLFASGTIFFIFNTVAESVYPGYSVRTNALSDLGAIGEPTTLLWDGQLFITGLLALIGIYLFLKSPLVTKATGKVVRAVYLLPPVGTIVVSLVPENTILLIHTLAAFTIFLFGGVSAIYTYRFTKAPFKYFSVVLGVIALAFTPFLSHPVYFGFGGAERLVVYPLIVWDTTLGSYLMGYSVAT